MEATELSLATIDLSPEPPEDEDSFGEEVEEEEPVLLGVVRPPSDVRLLDRHHFPSKVGGLPAWLDPLSLPSKSQSLCGMCGEPLKFLMQVYAPAGEMPGAFHRTIFVFVCPRLPCLLLHHSQQVELASEGVIHNSKDLKRSIRAFRCQLSRENKFYSQFPHSLGTPYPETAAAKLCDWCHSWHGDKRCGGCKEAVYCSESHQRQHWRGDHAARCRRRQLADGAKEDAVVEEVAGGARARIQQPWPELELIVEEEAEEDDVAAVSRSGARLSKAENSGSGAGDDDFRDTEEGQMQDPERLQWVAFEARIARAPEQVMRHCWTANAHVLWPSRKGQPSASSIPPCENCGECRIFEFQILPQLLYYMKVDPMDPDSLDWSTLAIYTCKNSCSVTSGDLQSSYLEEFVWVQPAA